MTKFAAASVSGVTSIAAMLCSRGVRRQSARVAILLRCLALAGIVEPPALAQSVPAAPTASVQGFLRDSQHHPVAAASVHLQAGNNTRTLTVQTGADGSYRFGGLAEGSYMIRAERKGFRPETFGPFALTSGQAKSLDLALGPLPNSPPAVLLPEFFDDPQFQVAGITEATNAGVHGSDAVRRSNEALARETVSLSGNSRAVSDAASGAAEESLREAVKRQPDSFEANFRLGKFLVEYGRASEALPYLQQASRLSPHDYQSSRQLARAYVDAGDLEQARATARAMLQEHDNADLHHLLGDIEEKLGSPLEAVRQYQKAVQLDPCEPYLFDWGAEFLKHGAVKPATEIFAKGNALFPHSARMLIGLGVAWYARGSYPQAAQYVFAASDLDPNDPAPYLFLGRMLNVQTAQTEGWVGRLGRFARLQPGNAMANYYYAVSLRMRSGDGESNLALAESLFKRAVELDPHLAAGYLELGILYADRRDYGNAVVTFLKAIEASPTLEEAHYRLAQAYRRIGEEDKAREQVRLYEQLSRQHTREVERERHEMQQFVFALRDPTAEPAEKP